jgi:hypothetical protein
VTAVTRCAGDAPVRGKGGRRRYCR